MISFLLRRVGFLMLTLVLTSLLIFSVTQFLPGDVARIILGREAGEAALRALRLEPPFFLPSRATRLRPPTSGSCAPQGQR